MSKRARYDPDAPYYMQSKAWVKPVNLMKACILSLMQRVIIDPCAGAGELIKYFPEIKLFDTNPGSSKVLYGNMMKINYGKFGPSTVVVSNIPFSQGSYPIEKMNYIASFDNVAYIAVVIASKYVRYLRDSQTDGTIVFNENFHIVGETYIDSTMFETINGEKVHCEISFVIFERRDIKRVEPKLEWNFALASHTPEWVHKSTDIIVFKVTSAVKDWLDIYDSACKNVRKIKSPVQRVLGSKEGVGMFYAWCYKNDRNYSFLKNELEKMVHGELMRRRHNNQSFGPGHMYTYIVTRGLMTVLNQAATPVSPVSLDMDWENNRQE